MEKNDVLSINIGTTLLIQEGKEFYNKDIQPGPILSGDRAAWHNKFKNIKPKGIVLTDTYNSPFFPIEYPQIDTTRLMLPEIRRRFKDYYATMETLYLPWHFHIEILDDADYHIFNTRPIDTKFPMDNFTAEKIIKKNKIELNSRSKQFFKTKPFDISESIHISIVGDTNTDVYTQPLYELIGRNCIGPILRFFKLPNKLYQVTWPLQIGNKFDVDLLDKYIQK